MSAVLVMGATGKVGRHVVVRLRELGHAVRPVSRSSPVRFDWADRSTWQPALAGADTLYLNVWGAVGTADPAEFTELAVRSGVRRIVALSGRGDDGEDYLLKTPYGPWAQAVLDGERAAGESGAEWTIVRPCWFAQTFEEDPKLSELRDGEVAIPVGDGTVPFVDATDIAAVAVAALTEDGHQEQSYELSGPRPLTFPEAVAEIARATGREIRQMPVEIPEYVRRLIGGGYDRAAAEMQAGPFEWLHRGKTGFLSDGVQRAIGREPRDFADYAKRAAATGVWSAGSPK
ncbi:NAD(P)H-binding protein [Amycolatopsis rubida]|uniref:NAD(P)H-binding protein n=1 Tax=Amycolatopsis rubida TaxID=112413 RepID=A0ABX0BHK2_9PSEU|nr:MULTISPECIES: NAD(P)H-binding protein [Amycolatopsis]MYW89837.1 NAD(P)H-binding protein [Amycolatopsis rubida]NEC54814.1 NAD(P)H-binding protein [Amycolatopsis rubida]OAP23179.1 NAD(P)H azoreductase [Amycolatopsis sp. M39]